ncbi:hypothetical protein ENTCAN_07303 [Enterobacter cancerogenus ATCC 35316]|nr:hypothetical protein ENTCAN_07303 [Enterobacter cancerogenus ATCC 35316]
MKALSICSGLFSCPRDNYCLNSKNPLRFTLFFCITATAIIFLT